MKRYQCNVIWVPVTLLVIGFFFATPFEELLRLPCNNLLVQCGQMSFEFFLCHRLVLIVVAKIDTGLCAWVLSLGISVVGAYSAYNVSKFVKRVRLAR